MIRIMSLLLLTGSLAACAGAAIESTRMSNDALVRNQYMDAALKGNAEAQYQVGRSYCCAPRSDVEAFYNNRKATEFLCRAARQGHADAAYEMGRIHSGNRIHGVRWLRRAANLVRGDGLEHEVIAYYWLNRAAQQDHVDARAMLRTLDDVDTRRAAERLQDLTTVPCTMDEVYGDFSEETD